MLFLLWLLRRVPEERYTGNAESGLLTVIKDTLSYMKSSRAIAQMVRREDQGGCWGNQGSSQVAADCASNVGSKRHSFCRNRPTEGMKRRQRAHNDFRRRDGWMTPEDYQTHRDQKAERL